MFINIKDRLDDPVVRRIMAACVYENSLENADKALAEYRGNHRRNLSGWIVNGTTVGVCGFRVHHTDRLEILHIAVAEDARRRGAGTAMVNVLRDAYMLPIHAETDDGAVGFYRKIGFATSAFEKYNVRRYACVLPAPDFEKNVAGLNADDVIIRYMPEITEDQLWAFYVRNDICEAGYGKDAAFKALRHGNSHIVAAFFGDALVGIVRAVFDGLTADIREAGLELALQGDDLRYENGSLIEKDAFGIFRRMGLLLLDELEKLGNTFTACYIVENLEDEAYQSIGMARNAGHLVYTKDTRNYV